MNMKSILSYFIAAVTALSLAACSDDNETEGQGDIEVPQQELTFNSNVNESSISIKTTGTWTASSDINWCKPRKKNGKGSTNLSLWVSPNITNKARSGKITIRANGETKTIPVSQPAYTADTTYIYRLPVIFHVLYKNRNDNKQYVSQKWLTELIDSVNLVYKRNNMNIQFHMARIDQNGDTLTEAGVMRKQISAASMDCDKFLQDDNPTYGNLNQNFQQYINIFLFKFTDENTMGITTLPNMPSTRELAGLNSMPGSTLQNITKLDSPWGVAINNDYIYEMQKWGYINPMYVVTTIAHELGHYLGLRHAFSEDECNEDDYCEDTKNCDYNAYIESIVDYRNNLKEGESPQASVLLTRSNCDDGELYHADNIMDYMYTLADKLTPDQRARTLRVLNYCPMVPGPKLETYTNSKSTLMNGQKIRLVPRLSNCPKYTPHNIGSMRK